MRRRKSQVLNLLHEIKLKTKVLSISVADANCLAISHPRHCLLNLYLLVHKQCNFWNIAMFVYLCKALKEIIHHKLLSGTYYIYGKLVEGTWKLINNIFTLIIYAKININSILWTNSVVFSPCRDPEMNTLVFMAIN